MPGNKILDTYASNPAHIIMNHLQWIRCYPLWPLLLLGMIIVSLLISCIFWYILVLFLVLLVINARYWNMVRSHLYHGDVNPAVVVSVQPLLIAVYSDLVMARGSYPVVKILSIPRQFLARRSYLIGQKMATVSIYQRSKDVDAWHWKDFSPVPVEYATAEKDVHERILKSITETEWTVLQESLATISEPYLPGLYPIAPEVIESIPIPDSDDILKEENVADIDMVNEFPPFIDASNNTFYCAGLICVEERPLCDFERNDMIKARREALLMGSLMLAACLASFIFAIFLLTRLMESFTKAKVLRKDLLSGKVRIYRGRLTSDGDYGQYGFAGYKRRLLMFGMLEENLRQVQTLEIMVGSGRIFYANGKLLSNMEIAEIQTVAATPEFAAIARQKEWMEEIDRTEDGDVILRNRRELQESECKELIMLAKKIELVFIYLVVILTSGLVAAVYSGIFTDKSNVFSSPFFYIYLIISMVYWYIFIQKRQWANNIRLRAQLGEVLILRRSSENQKYPDDIIEILPGEPAIPWTENGKPAAWRMNKR